MQKLSREEHVDELMLLNHSEEFFENPGMVEFVRGMMLQNPNPQPRRPSVASWPRRAATTRATGSARCRFPCT